MADVFTSAASRNCTSDRTDRRSDSCEWSAVLVAVPAPLEHSGSERRRSPLRRWLRVVPDLCTEPLATLRSRYSDWPRRSKETDRQLRPQPEHRCRRVAPRLYSLSDELTAVE